MRKRMCCIVCYPIFKYRKNSIEVSLDYFHLEGQCNFLEKAQYKLTIVDRSRRVRYCMTLDENFETLWESIMFENGKEEWGYIIYSNGKIIKYKSSRVEELSPSDSKNVLNLISDLIDVLLTDASFKVVNC